MKCCIAEMPRLTNPVPHMKDRYMSQQLTLSSLFCVLALAGLCVVTSVRELSDTGALVTLERAELSPGPFSG